MARLKIKQVKSSLKYDATNNVLTVSGSGNPSFVVSGSIAVEDNTVITGSLTIRDIDTFGDSGSFDSIDLGSY